MFGLSNACPPIPELMFGLSHACPQYLSSCLASLLPIHYTWAHVWSLLAVSRCCWPDPPPSCPSPWRCAPPAGTSLPPPAWWSSSSSAPALEETCDILFSELCPCCKTTLRFLTNVVCSCFGFRATRRRATADRVGTGTRRVGLHRVPYQKVRTAQSTRRVELDRVRYQPKG